LHIDPRYEFARSLENHKEIRRIKDENNVSLIQSAISTLTQLGNCIAFIRLLRSSSLNYLSKNVEFIPTIEDYYS